MKHTILNSVKLQSDSEVHRKRLRQRFLNAGRRAFADYELLELLLTHSIPRKDTKLIVKALLRKHKSLKAILDQPIERLEETEGIGPRSSAFITLIRSCIERYLEQRVEQKRSISSPQEVMQFVRMQLGAKQRESLMALYLSDSKHLLHHSIITEGMMDRTTFYPREILR